MAFLVATTSLAAVYHPNDDRWNAARSCQFSQVCQRSVQWFKSSPEVGIRRRGEYTDLWEKLLETDEEVEGEVSTVEKPTYKFPESIHALEDVVSEKWKEKREYYEKMAAEKIIEDKLGQSCAKLNAY